MQDGPGQRHRRVQLEVAVVVPGQARHAVARPDPERAQRPGQPGHPCRVGAVVIAEDFGAVVVADDRAARVVAPRALQEVGDEQLAHPASRSRTAGTTLSARYAIRSDPESTGSPGSCAQKCTSLICGQARSMSVSSVTAVSASISR